MNNNFYDIPVDWYKDFNDTFLKSQDMNKMNDMIKNMGIMNNMNNNIATPKEGFARGNLFNNLYDSYKNYRYRDLMPKNKREELLYNILKYKFTMIELQLYLDVNPYDKTMLDLYNRYLSEVSTLTKEYEKTYGPLTMDSSETANNKWNWIESPWPWEVMR